MNRMLLESVYASKYPKLNEMTYLKMGLSLPPHILLLMLIFTVYKGGQTAVTDDRTLVECPDQEESFTPSLILIMLSWVEGVKSCFGVFVFSLSLGSLLV